MFSALKVSLLRIIVGFLLAVAIGLPIGLAMGHLRMFERFIDPLIQSFRSIAPIAVLPLFILWFGQKDLTAALVVSYAAVFPIIVNTVAGVRAMEGRILDAARVLGLGEWAVVLRVLLPGSVPQIVAGMRIGMGLGWGSIIAAELAVGAKTGASGGIGQLMFASYAYELDVSNLIVYMISVGIVGLAMDVGFRSLIRAVSPTQKEQI